MKKRIMAFILVIALIFSVAPTSMADTTTSAKEGLVLDKTATYDNETGEGVINLSSYVKGAVESTPTDVVLVIDHSGSMWTAVNPDSGQLTYAQLDSEKGARRGYYVAFSKSVNAPVEENGVTVQNGIAHLMRYQNGKWQISGSMSSTTYENGKFLGFINTVDNSNTWTNLTNVDNYIYAQSISGALYDALNSFMEEMKNAVDCRVSVVTFAGAVSGSSDSVKWSKNAVPDGSALIPEYDYKGSGIFVDGKLTWDSTQPTLNKDLYKKAFEDPTTVEGQTILKNTIDAINTNYGNTPTAMGLLYARRLFIEAGRTDTQKIAIVFTDGIPSPAFLGTRECESCGHKLSDYQSGTENGKPIYDAKKVDCDYCDLVATGNSKQDRAVRTTYVDQAKKLRDDQKATVYSIGPSAGRAGTDVLQKMASGNDKVFNVGGDNLAQVFHDIAGVIVASSQELNKDSVLVDEMSNSFELPEGVNKNDIKVYTAKYKGVENGKDIFDTPKKFTDAEIEVDETSNTVKVSNFDYKSEAVFMAGNTPNGSKLIVEIPFVPTPDFLGGDDVVTNTSDSGIYNGETCVDKFPIPDVDVNVSTITPLCISKDIYLSQQASIPEVIKLGEYKQNGEEWEVNGINNAYVDIVYTVTDEDGNSMTYTIPAKTGYDALTNMGWSEDAPTHPLLKEDTTYTITCTVTSKNNPENTETGENESTIQVYKPEITFQDSVLENSYKENYPDNYVSVSWKHGETKADSSKMGNAPTLEYTYSPEAGAFTKDTPVQIMAVKAKKDDNKKIPEDQNIIEYVTFYRKDCSYDECDWGDEHDETMVVEHIDKTTGNVESSYVNFVIHVPTKNLEITKVVKGNLGDRNKEFEFTIDLSKSFEKIDKQGEKTTEVKLLDITDSANTSDVIVSSDDEITVERTENDGVYSFKLKNDQSIVFTVPYNTEYKITETDYTPEGYETCIAVDTGDSENKRYVENTIATDTSIVYTNTKNVTIDTGIEDFTDSNRILLSCLVAIMAIAAEFILFRFYRRKRIR